MVNTWERLTAVTSTLLRASAFIFLRWIPGHHFPPLILTLLVAYLTIIYTKPKAFDGDRPSLREAFPALFKHEKGRIVKENTEVAEVVDWQAYDDPVLDKDEHAYFKTLLAGIPDWREWEFSYLTIAINMLLTLFVLDLVLRGPLLYPSNDLRFSRLGYVDDQSAKILFREPDSQQLPVYAYYRIESEVQWTEAQKIYYVGPETDYTAPLLLDGLLSETKYVYSLSNNLSGTFRTAPASRSPNAGSLTFLTSSCIKANFPYRPFAHSLAIHGFEHLSRLVRSLSSVPAFMLFLGDFIYVDVPQRLSSSFAHYRSEYRRVYASPSWELQGLSSIPWIHTLDDHEIANDWSGGNQSAPFPAASDPFIHYHVSVNPPLPPSAPTINTNTTYFQFTQGPASFFMLDTRRYRTDPEPKDPIKPTAKPLYGSSNSPPNPPGTSEKPASMLGQAQLESLLTFLRTPEPLHVHWKFVASSVPFTKNWRFGTSDTWGGFLTERSRILKAMHEAEANLNVRVIILSGDRHEFAAVRFPPPVLYLDTAATSTVNTNVRDEQQSPPKEPIYDHTPQSGPHEFSVGPLSMFYLPIRTFKQIDNEDVAIKYLPDGNSKVGVITLQNLGASSASSTTNRNDNSNHHDNEGGQQSLFKYSLWIDGNVAWEYTLTSPSSSSSSSSSRFTNERIRENKNGFGGLSRLWS